jgi:prepilin-type processing-associated H-X9-DG protein
MRHRLRTASRHAFTFIDLLVLIALVVLAIAFLLPAMSRTGGSANRVKCGSNLRQIGQAMILYANENNGQFPRTTYDPTDPTPRAYTGALAKNPFATTGPQPNDVTAALFLLLRTQDIIAHVFVCPSSVAEGLDVFRGGLSAQSRSNFPSDDNLSYSLANPYPSPAAENDGYAWTNTRTADFALAADMNPGQNATTHTDPTRVTTMSSAADLQALANSRNHQGGGQNVLYGDGHAEFNQTPFCGVDQDNIYGPGKLLRKDPPRLISPVISGPINASPDHKDDSVLLPVAVGPTRYRLWVRTGGPAKLGIYALLATLAAMILWRWVMPLWRRCHGRPRS